MKKVYIKIILLLFGFQLKSQSINCVRNISTNPEDRINNEFTTDIRSDLPNYFLNTNFNWYPNGSIQIDPTRPWVRSFGGNQNFYQFKHPYAPSMPDQFRYLSYYPDGREIGIADLDLYWEDGWELLWMNLGYLPNGASTDNVDTDWSSSGAFPISPDNVPFFVQYNRYRGLLRVFANVWYTEIGQWDDIKVRLAFDTDENNTLDATGIWLLTQPILLVIMPCMWGEAL